jgi:hypothetical protein
MLLLPEGHEFVSIKTICRTPFPVVTANKSAPAHLKKRGLYASNSFNIAPFTAGWKWQ